MREERRQHKKVLADPTKWLHLDDWTLGDMRDLQARRFFPWPATVVSVSLPCRSSPFSNRQCCILAHEWCMIYTQTQWEENINLVGWLPHLKATQTICLFRSVAVFEFETARVGRQRDFEPVKKERVSCRWPRLSRKRASWSMGSFFHTPGGNTHKR